MMKGLFGLVVVVVCGTCLLMATGESFASPTVSDATEACLTCHASIHPGMVADWRKSLHSQVSPEEALKKDPMSRRISAEEVPEDLARTVVGCAECHMLNSEKHKDTFEHNGFTVHVVVTPETDSSICNFISYCFGYVVEIPVIISVSVTVLSLFENVYENVDCVGKFANTITNLLSFTSHVPLTPAIVQVPSENNCDVTARDVFHVPINLFLSLVTLLHPLTPTQIRRTTHAKLIKCFFIMPFTSVL